MSSVVYRFIYTVFYDNISTISPTSKYFEMILEWFYKAQCFGNPIISSQVSSFGSVLSVARLLWILQAGSKGILLKLSETQVEFLVGICGDLGRSLRELS